MFDLIGVLSFPNVVRLKAMNGEKLIGFIAGEIKRGKRMAWIATVCVHPDYRGLGVGKRLLSTCETRLDMPRVRLTVRSSNQAALALYSKCGYSRVNLWARYYQGGEDGIEMEKAIELP
jgi:ribosomal-protein-alanine N-acetyltransferase